MLPEADSACCPKTAGLAARFRRGQCNRIQHRVFASPAGYTLTSSGWLLLNWVYFINSSKMIGNFHAVLNQFFFKLNRFICNYEPVLSDHWCRILDKCLYNNLHITTHFPRPNYLIQNSLFTTTMTTSLRHSIMFDRLWIQSPRNLCFEVCGFYYVFQTLTKICIVFERTSV